MVIPTELQNSSNLFFVSSSIRTLTIAIMQSFTRAKTIKNNVIIIINKSFSSNIFITDKRI